MASFSASFQKNRTRWLIISLMVLAFLLASQGMSAKDWVVTVLRGLSVGAITFLVASGFSIILGLMDVLNLAHGTLFMIGAYVGWTVYVRPDTVVDLITPLSLLIAGFLLMPLLARALSGLRLSAATARLWPWLTLVLAAGIVYFSLANAPISAWNPEVYTDSPIVWTQNMQTGVVETMVKPAGAVGASPWLVWLGVLVGGVILAGSLAGFTLRRRAARPARVAAWRTLALFAGLSLFGIAVYLLNDALTAHLFHLSTNWLFVLAIVLATLTGMGLGGLMEMTLIRPLYERTIYQIMLTFGLAFIGTEIVRALWGRSGFTMPRPEFFAGRSEGCPATSVGAWLQHRCAILALEIGGETARIRAYNEIFIILMGLVVLIGVWIILQRTRLGMIIRAGVQDDEMVQALGINVRRIFTLVFALGVGLAALGGVLAAPAMGLSDAMGANFLLAALIALAIGGLTSYPGAALGSLIVGLLQQFIIKYGQIGIPLPFLDEPFKPTPPLVPASTILLMVLILLIMPQGLLGRKE